MNEIMTIMVYFNDNKLGEEVSIVGVVEEIVNSFFYKVAFAESTLMIDIRETKYELL